VHRFAAAEGHPIPISPGPSNVQFTGLTLPTTDYVDYYAHANDGAAAVAVKYKDDLKTAGTLLATARQDAFVTQAVMELVAP